MLNITKKGSKIKWIESLKLNLNAIVEICNCLLVYAVHEQHDSSGVACGTLISDQPHSKEHGLVEVEMISLTSHDHLFFRNYNGEVYGRMERAPSGLQYASAIVRFRKKQEDNEAFWELVAQHAGKPVWEKRIKDSESYKMNHKWTGMTQKTLENHIDCHRFSFVRMI